MKSKKKLSHKIVQRTVKGDQFNPDCTLCVCVCLCVAQEATQTLLSTPLCICKCPNIHDSIKCEMQHKGGNVDNAGVAAVRQPWHVSKEQRERERNTGYSGMRCWIIYYISSEQNKTVSSSVPPQPKQSLSSYVCIHTDTCVCMSAQCVNVRQA